MITLPPSVRIFVAINATDMRKSFDGLSLAVQAELRQPDPTSGHLYVFWNRRGDQIRILFWDRTGYCIFAKRLAQGTFRFGKTPKPGEFHVDYEAAELALVLEGIDLTNA